MSDEDHYIRSSSSNDRSNYSLFKAFKYAGAGISYAFKTQRNIRIDACFAILAIALGFLFEISTTQWAIIFVCIGMVMGLECANTAIESVVDLASPDYHILAKHAKDAAAGAVYICAIASVIVACFIFVPPMLKAIGLSA